MFFNRMKNIDVIEICSCFDTLLHIISMIAYKTLSTIFPYLIALLSLEMLMKYLNDYAAVNIPSVDHITCSSNIWRNVFYIDQFYPLEERVSFCTSLSGSFAFRSAFALWCYVISLLFYEFFLTFLWVSLISHVFMFSNNLLYLFHNFS